MNYDFKVVVKQASEFVFVFAITAYGGSGEHLHSSTVAID
jgi:hypothetical protein